MEVICASSSYHLQGRCLYSILRQADIHWASSKPASISPGDEDNALEERIVRWDSALWMVAKDRRTVTSDHWSNMYKK